MAKKSNLKISVVLPIYNEEKTIATVINTIKQVMENQNYEYEIIAVNDCSTDKTELILNSISNINVLNHPFNKGYGSALKTGITAAKGDYILMMDADGTYLAEEIPFLLKYMDKYDMVVGARTGKNVKIPISRRPAKYILNTIANLLTGKKIPDINSGFRLFKKELALKFFYLFPPGFSFTTTITMAAVTNDYNVKYVQINYLKRKGKSTLKPKEFFNFITLIFRLVTYFEPLKIFLPTGIFLFLAGVIYAIYQFITTHNLAQLPIILILASLQILFMGLIADIIVKQRK